MQLCMERNAGKRVQADAKPSDETMSRSPCEANPNKLGRAPATAVYCPDIWEHKSVNRACTDEICSLSELQENAKRSLQSTTAGLPPRLKHRPSYGMGRFGKSVQSVTAIKENLMKFGCKQNRKN